MNIYLNKFGLKLLGKELNILNAMLVASLIIFIRNIWQIKA